MNKAFNIYSIYHVGRFEIFLYVSISWSQPPILVFEILQMYLAASQDRFANICNLVNIVNIVNNVRIVIIVIIVIIVNIVNIGSQGVSRGGDAVKKPSCMREDLSVIESDLSEGLPRIVHGGGSPL